MHNITVTIGDEAFARMKVLVKLTEKDARPLSISSLAENAIVGAVNDVFAKTLPGRYEPLKTRETSEAES